MNYLAAEPVDARSLLASSACRTLRIRAGMQRVQRNTVHRCAPETRPVKPHRRGLLMLMSPCLLMKAV